MTTEQARIAREAFQRVQALKQEAFEARLTVLSLPKGSIERHAAHEICKAMRESLSDAEMTLQLAISFSFPR